MASFPSATAGRGVTVLGEWLHPESSYPRRSAAERQIQRRAGLLGFVAIVSGSAAVLLSTAAMMVYGLEPVPTDPAFGSALLPAAIALVIITVFAPQAMFRTQIATRTREILRNPSSPLPPWRSSTLTFDAILVGALLAGIYFDGILALAFFGLALSARVVFQSRRHLEADPNARFHTLVSAWSSGLTGVVAFLIVHPLVTTIDEPAGLLPLAFAALVAMYVGLGLNSIERWVYVDRTPWAFLRDAVDLRRIVVAIVSGLMAWLVSFVGHGVDELASSPGSLTGILAGVGALIVAWLMLWYFSILLWRRDALRTLALWAAHQTEVVGRIADGSLDPVLAGRAAAPTTARMAISVFGATRAMVVSQDSDGEISTVLVGADVFPDAPPPDPRSLVSLPHMRMPIYPLPGHANLSSVTIAGWLWPGWFITRSKTFVRRFTELASHTLLVPRIAEGDDRTSSAFDTMFTPVLRWPTLSAFAEAVKRMKGQADASPQTSSLLIAAYAIDDFGALAGGKFEQAAVGQVMRLAFGFTDFSGQDAFVAYQEPGRVWVALAGGPIIRNQVGTLRGLQQYINDHGSVSSARMDVDVHVSVSFGYAAYQVDDFSYEGLLAKTLERLATDQASRDPFGLDVSLSLDFSPEDIITSTETPLTAVDVLDLIRQDRQAQERDGIRRFPANVSPIIDVATDTVAGLVASVAWLRTVGAVDASQPESFRALVNRQVDVAAEGALAALAEVKDLLAAASETRSPDLPVLVWLPPVLLTPEAGEFSLPNLMTPFLSRAECARTVVLLDTIPRDSGQTLRVLADRGVHVAVTAGAAAAADPVDLDGWRRWAVIFPQQLMQGTQGVDVLTVQQTASAIAGPTTRLIGIADANVDLRDLEATNIQLVVRPGVGISLADPNDLRTSVLGEELDY